MSEILFADDDEALRLMLADALAAGGHEVRLASNGNEALAEIRRRAPDLILLDNRMGSPNGIEVCRTIKTDPRLQHLPVLILTGQSGLDDRLEGFDAGADDYLAKPVDPRELRARVAALLRLTQQILDRNPTTNLPGGTAVELEMERLRGLGKPFSVCYLDLDHFKPFADRFGFATSNAVIRAVGEVVRAQANRPEVFAGHIGGDDFVLISDPIEVRHLAEQARSTFADRLKALLPADTVRNGSYSGKDRGGIARDFPLTSLTAAVVHVDPARITSLASLGEAVAEAKQRAKQEETGIDETTLGH